jgi:uncharacterized membrane protein YdbT with pleckstrin-like domain
MSGACLMSACAGGALAGGHPKSAAYCLGVALLCLLLAGLGRLDRSYRVTTQRVVLRAVFLARRVIEIELREARDLTLSQSLAQRLLGIGTVEVSPSTQGEAVSFAGIADPEAVKETIRRARRAAGTLDRGDAALDAPGAAGG